MDYAKPDVTKLGDAAQLIGTLGTGHESNGDIPGPVPDE